MNKDQYYKLLLQSSQMGCVNSYSPRTSGPSTSQGYVNLTSNPRQKQTQTDFCDDVTSMLLVESLLSEESSLFKQSEQQQIGVQKQQICDLEAKVCAQIQTNERQKSEISQLNNLLETTTKRAEEVTTGLQNKVRLLESQSKQYQTVIQSMKTQFTREVSGSNGKQIDTLKTVQNQVVQVVVQWAKEQQSSLQDNMLLIEQCVGKITQKGQFVEKLAVPLQQTILKTKQFKETIQTQLTQNKLLSKSKMDLEQQVDNQQLDNSKLSKDNQMLHQKNQSLANDIVVLQGRYKQIQNENNSLRMQLDDKDIIISELRQQQEHNITQERSEYLDSLQLYDSICVKFQMIVHEQVNEIESKMQQLGQILQHTDQIFIDACDCGDVILDIGFKESSTLKYNQIMYAINDLNQWGEQNIVTKFQLVDQDKEVVIGNSVQKQCDACIQAYSEVSDASVQLDQNIQQDESHFNDFIEKVLKKLKIVEMQQNDYETVVVSLDFQLQSMQLILNADNETPTSQTNFVEAANRKAAFIIDKISKLTEEIILKWNFYQQNVEKMKKMKEEYDKMKLQQKQLKLRERDFEEEIDVVSSRDASIQSEISAVCAEINIIRQESQEPILLKLTQPQYGSGEKVNVSLERNSIGIQTEVRIVDFFMPVAQSKVINQLMENHTEVQDQKMLSQCVSLTSNSKFDTNYSLEVAQSETKRSNTHEFQAMSVQDTLGFQIVSADFDAIQQKQLDIYNECDVVDQHLDSANRFLHDISIVLKEMNFKEVSSTIGQIRSELHDKVDMISLLGQQVVTLSSFKSTSTADSLMSSRTRNRDVSANRTGDSESEEIITAVVQQQQSKLMLSDFQQTDVQSCVEDVFMTQLYLKQQLQKYLDTMRPVLQLAGWNKMVIAKQIKMIELLVNKQQYLQSRIGYLTDLLKQAPVIDRLSNLDEIKQLFIGFSNKLKSIDGGEHIQQKQNDLNDFFGGGMRKTSVFGSNADFFGVNSVRGFKYSIGTGSSNRQSFNASVHIIKDGGADEDVENLSLEERAQLFMSSSFEPCKDSIFPHYQDLLQWFNEFNKRSAKKAQTVYRWVYNVYKAVDFIFEIDNISQLLTECSPIFEDVDKYQLDVILSSYQIQQLHQKFSLFLLSMWNAENQQSMFSIIKQMLFVQQKFLESTPLQKQIGYDGLLENIPIFQDLQMDILSLKLAAMIFSLRVLGYQPPECCHDVISSGRLMIAHESDEIRKFFTGTGILKKLLRIGMIPLCNKEGDVIPVLVVPNSK